MSAVDVLPLDFDLPDEVDAPVAIEQVPIQASIQLPAPVALEATPEEVVAPAPPSAAPTATPRKDKKTPAAKTTGPDEWGLFDPDKCGFAALLAQLDRLKHSIDDEPQEPDANTPVAAY